MRPRLICAAAAQESDTASVEAFYREWFGSVQQGASSYASFYAEDGQLFPPMRFPFRAGRRSRRG